MNNLQQWSDNQLRNMLVNLRAGDFRISNNIPRYYAAAWRAAELTRIREAIEAIEQELLLRAAHNLLERLNSINP